MTDNNEVAKIIVEQIRAGFNMQINLGAAVHKVDFFRFVGADKLGYTDNSLSFTAKRGKGRPSVRCVITLNSGDLYDIELYTMRKFESKKIKEVNDIFFTELTETLLRELEI